MFLQKLLLITRKDVKMIHEDAIRFTYKLNLHITYAFSQ
ncbi:UNVERIFIED_ORG: hypothetical protein ABRZ91_003333 [Heyndrickxia coagulans]